MVGGDGDSAPTHKRRKLVKTYKKKKKKKKCSLTNGLWLLKYAERPTPYMIIKKAGVEKRP